MGGSAQPCAHPSPMWGCPHSERPVPLHTAATPGSPEGDRKLSQPTSFRSRDRRREPLLPPQPLLSLSFDLK